MTRLGALATELKDLVTRLERALEHVLTECHCRDDDGLIPPGASEAHGRAARELRPKMNASLVMRKPAVERTFDEVDGYNESIVVASDPISLLLRTPHGANHRLLQIGESPSLTVRSADG